jgi:ATP synthase F1 epsilon subunit
LAAERVFNCVVIAPAGKLVDCKTTCVIFTAHDGQVGVLYNHMPMFCELGLGIMEVRRPTDDQQVEKMSILVDGGFAMVCSNLLKVLSYDVVFPRELKPDDLEQIMADLKKELSSDTLEGRQRQHQARKLALLTQLTELTTPAR